MSSHRGGDRRLWGLKTITLFPSNPARGLDMHQGFVALFDGETGQVRGILSTSASTAIRTAAVSGLSTRLLARPGARSVAIIGAGVQGKAHVDAMHDSLAGALAQQPDHGTAEPREEVLVVHAALPVGFAALGNREESPVGSTLKVV